MCNFEVIDQWAYGADSEGWITSIDKMLMEGCPFQPSKSEANEYLIVKVRVV